MRSACIKMLLAHNITPVLKIQPSLRARQLKVCWENRNFAAVFDIRRPFRAKRFEFVKINRTLSSVFDVRINFVRTGSNS